MSPYWGQLACHTSAPGFPDQTVCRNALTCVCRSHLGMYACHTALAGSSDLEVPARGSWLVTSQLRVSRIRQCVPAHPLFACRSHFGQPVSASCCSIWTYAVAGCHKAADGDCGIGMVDRTLYDGDGYGDMPRESTASDSNLQRASLPAPVTDRMRDADDTEYFGPMVWDSVACSRHRRYFGHA